MQNLVKMNERLFKMMNDFIKQLGKTRPMIISYLKTISFEKYVAYIAVIFALAPFIIDYYGYKRDSYIAKKQERQNESIREKTFEITDKLNSLELKCPETPACNCPQCPTCPVCPACNCSEEKKCPEEKAVTLPKVQIDTVDKGNGKQFLETGVDSLENSNNMFSNFYSFFNNEGGGDPSIINVTANKATNANKESNANTASSANTASNANKATKATKANTIGGELDGFEKVPGYAVIPER